MRKLTIKSPEYGKFAKLGQYEDRKLTSDKLPDRVDFEVMVVPNKAPTEQEKKAVEDKALYIASGVLLDEKPLTNYYDFKLHLSSHNPAGTWAVPNYRYYLVGSLKKGSPQGQPALNENDQKIKQLKEIIKKNLLEMLNS